MSCTFHVRDPDTGRSVCGHAILGSEETFHGRKYQEICPDCVAAYAARAMVVADDAGLRSSSRWRDEHWVRELAAIFEGQA